MRCQEHRALDGIRARRRAEQQGTHAVRDGAERQIREAPAALRERGGDIVESPHVHSARDRTHASRPRRSDASVVERQHGRTGAGEATRQPMVEARRDSGTTRHDDHDRCRRATVRGHEPGCGELHIVARDEIDRPLVDQDIGARVRRFHSRASSIVGGNMTASRCSKGPTTIASRCGITLQSPRPQSLPSQSGVCTSLPSPRRASGRRTLIAPTAMRREPRCPTLMH